MRSHRAWLLVGLIALISAVLVGFLGVSFLLTEHVRSSSLHQNQTRAIYLAQAGAMQSFYDFRRGNGVVLGEQTVVAGPAAGTTDDDVFVLSGQAADFLLANMQGATFPNASICGASREAISWSVRNVLANTAGSFSLTINQIQVDWSAPTERVLRIDLDGTGADWLAPGCGAGCPACVGVAAGTAINLAADGVPVANRTIAPNSIFSPNRIWFSVGNIHLKEWIDITFMLSDGSSVRAHCHISGANGPNTADFRLNADGIARRVNFPFTVRRQLRATYRMSTTSLTATGWVKSYEEP